MKTLNRLVAHIGSSLGWLLTSTPPSRTAPTVVPSAGTKFFQYGENITSSAMNRAIGAVSSDVDEVAFDLNTPTVRPEILQPITDSSISTGVYGFSALDLSDIDALTVGSDLVLDLAADNGSVRPPFKWVYTGLNKRELSSGGVMRLHRQDSFVQNGGTSDLSESGYSKEVFIDDVFVNNGSSSIYGTQLYMGSSKNSLPSRVPGIDAVSPDMLPYSGTSYDAVIESWHSDGLTLDGVTASDLGLVPGCFLLITGSTHNDGLFCVRSYAGGRISLYRGGLIKVVVASGTGFSTGSLVAWRSKPNHDNLTSYDQCNNKAYVMYKDGTTLYLWVPPIPTDSGSDVSSKAHSSLGGVVSDSGTLACDFDFESAANQLNSLVVGTELMAVNYSDITSSTVTTVDSVVAPHYPVIMNVGDAVGGSVVATPMNPIGFRLNPTLIIKDIDTKPYKAFGGAYTLECKTLCRLKDTLKISPVYGDAFSTDETVVKHRANLRTFLRHLHVGNAEPTDYEESLNGAFSPTRSILGTSLWLIRGTQTLDNTKGLGYPFENGDSAFDQGDTISITHPTAGYGVTKAVVVSGWGEYLLLRDVSRDGWANLRAKTDFSVRSIAVNSTFVDSSAVSYTVSAIFFPKIRVSNNGSSSSYIETPPPGLNTLYHNYYSANHGERGAAQGRHIALLSGKPILIVPAAAASQVTLEVYTDQTTTYLLQERTSTGVQVRIGTTTTEITGKKTLTLEATHNRYSFFKDSSAHTTVDTSSESLLKLDVTGSAILLRNSSGTARASINFSGDSLGFSDLNTGVLSDINLSGADYNYLPFYVFSSSPPSILASLHASLPGDIDTTVYGHGILSGGTVSTVSLVLSVAATVFLWRGRTRRVPASPDVLTMTNGTSRYLVYDHANDQYALASTIDATDDEITPLAYLVASGGSVIRNISIFTLLNRSTERSELWVGAVPSGNSFTNGVMHYPNLGSAFSAITLLQAATGGSRPYTIRVAGNCTESESSVNNISFPMSIPVHGLHIVGSSDSSGNVGTVSWSTAKFLLNLNKTGVVIENLRFRFTGTPSYGSSPETGLFTCSFPGLSPAWNARISNVSLGYSSDPCETFFFSDASDQGACTSLTINNCYSLTTNAFYHSENSSRTYDSVILSDNIIVQVGTDASSGATSAIFSNTADTIRVSGNTVKSEGTVGLSTGVSLADSADGGVIVDNNSVSGCKLYGIQLEHTTSETDPLVGRGAKVNNNSVLDCGTDSGGVGVRVGLRDTIVSGNYVSGGCKHAAIELFSGNVVAEQNNVRGVDGSGVVVRGVQNGVYGYSAQSPIGIVVKSCNLQDIGEADVSGDAGIVVASAAPAVYYTVIDGCTIAVNSSGNGAVRTNVNKAIHVYDNALGAEVTNNTIIGAFGVVFAANKSTFSHNTMTKGSHATERLSLLNVDCDDMLIVGNRWLSQGGIYVASVTTASGQRIKILDNFMGGSAPSIYFNSSADIADAHICRNTVYGIGSSGLTPVFTRAIISQNVLRGGSLRLGNSSSACIVSDNLLATYPIVVGNNCINVSITGNLGSGSGSGLTTGSSCGMLRIVGNRFYDAVTVGASTTESTIDSNSISGGALTLSASSEDIRVTGNVIDNYDIVINSNCKRIDASNNLLGSGIVSAPSTVLDVIVSHNTCGGIQLLGNNRRCTIHANNTQGGNIQLGAPETVNYNCTVSNNNTGSATTSSDGGDITICCVDTNVSANITAGGDIVLLNETAPSGTSDTPLVRGGNTIANNSTTKQDVSGAGEIRIYNGGNVVTGNNTKYSNTSGHGSTIEFFADTGVAAGHYNIIIGNITTGIVGTNGTDVLSGNITS